MQFPLILLIAGILMFAVGAYTKNQMMLLITEFHPAQRQLQTRQFINFLIKIANDDFWKVFDIAKVIIILGLFIWIFSLMSFLLAYTCH
jgi:hypothetical protein